jgi:hypothetical protein
MQSCLSPHAAISQLVACELEEQHEPPPFVADNAAASSATGAAATKLNAITPSEKAADKTRYDLEIRTSGLP